MRQKLYLVSRFRRPPFHAPAGLTWAKARITRKYRKYIKITVKPRYKGRKLIRRGYFYFKPTNIVFTRQYLSWVQVKAKTIKRKRVFKPRWSNLAVYQQDAINLWRAAGYEIARVAIYPYREVVRETSNGKEYLTRPMLEWVETRSKFANDIKEFPPKNQKFIFYSLYYWLRAPIAKDSSSDEGYKAVFRMTNFLEKKEKSFKEILRKVYHVILPKLIARISKGLNLTFLQFMFFTVKTKQERKLSLERTQYHLPVKKTKRIILED